MAIRLGPGNALKSYAMERQLFVFVVFRNGRSGLGFGDRLWCSRRRSLRGGLFGESRAGPAGRADRDPEPASSQTSAVRWRRFWPRSEQWAPFGHEHPKTTPSRPSPGDPRSTSKIMSKVCKDGPPVLPTTSLARRFFEHVCEASSLLRIGLAPGDVEAALERPMIAERNAYPQFVEQLLATCPGKLPQ